MASPGAYHHIPKNHLVYYLTGHVKQYLIAIFQFGLETNLPGLAIAPPGYDLPNLTTLFFLFPAARGGAHACACYVGDCTNGRCADFYGGGDDGYGGIGDGDH